MAIEDIMMVNPAGYPRTKKGKAWRSLVKKHGVMRASAMWRHGRKSNSWFDAPRAHRKASLLGWRRRRRGSENPMGFRLGAFTQGVTLYDVGVATLGIIAVLSVPRLVKYDTGWKDVLVSGATTFFGGFLISKVSRAGAIAFVIGAGSLTVMKAIRLLIAGTKVETYVADMGIHGLGAVKERGILSQEEELFGQEDELFGQEEEIFGQEEEEGEEIVGADVIRPTYSGIDDIGN